MTVNELISILQGVASIGGGDNIIVFQDETNVSYVDTADRYGTASNIVLLEGKTRFTTNE